MDLTEGFVVMSAANTYKPKLVRCYVRFYVRAQNAETQNRKKTESAKFI
jgi:hypothetical protein